MQVRNLVALGVEQLLSADVCGKRSWCFLLLTVSSHVMALPLHFRAGGMTTLREDSPCDNVLLEWSMAVLLNKLFGLKVTIVMESRLFS